MKTSFVNKSLSLFGVKLIRLRKDAGVRLGNTYNLEKDDESGIDIEVRKLLNLLAYTKTNVTEYNAEEFVSGYHTLKVDGHDFAGQRNPDERLKDVPFDFRGATVLDLGCNQGGMLMAVADRIKAGVGVDFDPKMINAANRIRAHKQLQNVNYYVFDLEKENLELLRNFLPGTNVSIVFLLAVCMWIKNWRDVIQFARSMSDNMLFESNGVEQQQREQEEYLRSCYASVTMVRESSTDDPRQKQRRLFLCSAHGSN